MARPRAEHERGSTFLAGVFENADPETAAFMARHQALLERVAVLERALEKLTERETVDVNGEYEFERFKYGPEAAHLAQKALDA